MLPDDKDKRKRPWNDYGYVVLIVVAILIAYFVVLPVGEKVAGVFQALTDALANRK